MPRKLETTEGDPQEMVNLQLLVPRWLKNRCVETAQKRAKSLSDWVRDVFVAATEDEERKPRRHRG